MLYRSMRLPPAIIFIFVNGHQTSFDRIQCILSSTITHPKRPNECRIYNT